MYCADWLAVPGNTPEKVAGNKYVTIAKDGTVTYDPATAAADAKAAQWVQVRGQRDALMADTDYVITRHTEQSALVAAGKLAAAKLTKDQILEVQVYRQVQKLLGITQTGELIKTRPACGNI